METNCSWGDGLRAQDDRFTLLVYVQINIYKNGLILPTGQWYAPSAVIIDAWNCMVWHGIEWF